MALLPGIIARANTLLLTQRGHLFPWAPVFLAMGIGSYFAMLVEPAPLLLVGCAAISVAAAFLALWLKSGAAPVIWALALLAAGLPLAAMRAHLVAGPVLTYRYYGPVEGRVVGLDRSASGALRVTLDQAVLARLAPEATPRRLRVALHGDQHWHAPQPGERVLVTAHLSPPAGPAEPGGFDFRRHAWFQRLGAVGYARTPLLLLEPATKGSVARLRMDLSARIKTALPGERGAVAAALMTGDRTALSADLLRDLRRANLAHLLAISGLHMGLVSGFVFALVRLMLAAVPYIGLRVPAKKIAALAALTAAAGYLLLSGGNVATERAFVMVAVMLVALLFDRRAISLRAVAVAALVVLVLRPESLLSPGFQMSFAATTALVAVFAGLRDSNRLPRGRLGGPLTLLLSSAVAGLATAPFAAAHFNMVSQMGLLANLASVPLMGAFVMPAAVLAAVVMPLGLEAWPLWLMGQGIAWITAVAHWISEQEMAVRHVVSPGSHVLPLLSLGALCVILWQGRLRWGGSALVALALVGWLQSERPDLLIAETGGLVGVVTPDGRALSKSRGSGFVAGAWLENDGAPMPQEAAAALWPAHVVVEQGALRVIAGKKAAAGAWCDKGDWLVSNQRIEQPLPCQVFDPKSLKQTGSIAVFDGAAGVRIETARQRAGDRLWNHWVWQKESLLTR